MILLSNVSCSVKSEDDSEKIILSDINLRIEKGTRLGIMGRNGSGKTSLANLIAGLVLPVSGEVRINYIPTGDDRFQANLGKNVGIVFQNPENQIVTVTVERELALGLENYGYISEAIHHNVNSQLAKYHIEHLRKKMPGKISGGEKQKLALASVLILGPEILILDEPMAHLDSEGKKIFQAELGQVMKNDNVTIIYITQDLSEIMDFERVVILDHGIIVEDCIPSDLIESDRMLNKYAIQFPAVLLSKNLTRNQISDALAKFPGQQLLDEKNTEESISLECQKLSFTWKGGENIIEELNLTLHKGKVHGLLGKIGCGKSTLALLMGGLLKPQKGAIYLDGNPANQAELVKKAVYIFQSPERGLFATTLYEDVEYGPKNFGYAGKELQLVVEKAFEDVGLNLKAFRDRSPHTLSGGEARLAGIAGGLATGKKIIILDEPTEELDFSGRLQIIDLIEKLTSEEKTVMLISHDSNFLFNICDEISIWIDRKVRTCPKLELYDNTNLFAEAEIDMPEIIRLAQKYAMTAEFRKKGVASLGNLLSGNGSALSGSDREA